MRLLFIIMLTLSTFVNAQSAARWGHRILFGTTFVSTDSLRIISYRDTVLADTMYSDALATPDWTVGQYAVEAFMRNIGGTTDSISLDVRRGTKFYDKSARVDSVKFSSWYSVFDVIASGSLQDTLISYPTSSWFKQNNFLQYRIYDESVSTDTTKHFVADYLR